MNERNMHRIQCIFEVHIQFCVALRRTSDDRLIENVSVLHSMSRCLVVKLNEEIELYERMQFQWTWNIEWILTKASYESEARAADVLSTTSVFSLYLLSN